MHVIFILLILFTGCRLGPPYRPPCVEIPDTWKTEQPTPTPSACIDYWWEVFGDETLNVLEEQAIANNPSLYAAMDRVAQARAIAGVDRSALYPQVNLTPSYSNQGALFKLFLPPGSTLPLGTNFPTIYRIHQLQYTMPLSMSYEIDLWGKVRGQYESAVFNAQAQEENLQAALLSLTADLATAYYKMRTFDAQTLVIENNLDLLRRSFALTQSRFKKGLIGESDVFAASQEVSDNEAVYFDTLRQRALQVDAIAALIGVPASAFCLPLMPLETPPPVICAGCPSTVLLQRPDIGAAERTMASVHATIGVAYASFFPSFSLTGMLGFSSPDLGEFLKWKSRYWAWGIDASQPIFNAGLNIANLNLVYAQYSEAAHNYEQKVLTAFQEVEDALVSLEMEAKQYQSYEASTQASNKRATLSANRYAKGLANYLEVLDSERSKVAAESNQVNVLGLRYLSTIQLIKALGGSWSQPVK